MSYWETLTIWGAVATGAGAVAGAIVSVIFFFKTYKGTKKSEEIKYSHDINYMLSEANQSLNEAVSEGDNEMVEKNSMAILDVWEWFAFLVINKSIENKELLEYYKARMEDGYEILQKYSDVMNDDTKFQKFKELCKMYGIKNH